jgi:4-amino-4-deoxy-L-arabinose transferase-like glycosyltransferase
VTSALETSTTSRREWLWVALFAIVTTCAFLGLRGIWDPDEGRYTNVALNMLESGDWLIPRRSAEVGHWTKPPLTYWAIASSVWALGSTALAARLPSALAHLLCVLLVGRIAHRLVPGQGTRAALVYAAMLFPFGAAQYVSTDYVLTAMETLAMWAYVEARFVSVVLLKLVVELVVAHGLVADCERPEVVLRVLDPYRCRFGHFRPGQTDLAAGTRNSEGLF